MDDDAFSDALWNLAGDAEPGNKPWTRLARAIRQNPQAHIDALVEAGVLECDICTVYADQRLHYRVVQPHVHEWHRIGGWLDGVDGELWLREECATCKDTKAGPVKVLDGC